MFFAPFSSLPIRFSRLNFKLFVLAASVLLLPLAERSSAQTFGGSNPISVSGSVGTSEGSTATVSGVSGTVTAISVTLTNLDITSPTSDLGGLNSVAMVLVPPSGSGLKPLDLLSGICGSGTEQVGNSTFTLADTGDTGTDNTSGMLPGLGISTCPSTLSGTYLPTDYFPAQDTFNSPGPGTNYNSGGTSPSTDGSGTFNFTRAFGLPTTASSLNGTWTLYIATQAGTTYAGSPSLGSWTITFTTEAATATATSLSTNNNGQTSNVFTNGNVGGQSTTGTQVTFTATVTANSNPVTAGTVTFYDSTGTSPGTGPVLASSVPVNGSGQAQANVTFSASEEGSRTISAVYSGVPGTFASSTTPPGGEVTELTVNRPYNPSNGTTFCNGPVAIENSLGEPIGGTAGFPYPSQLVLGSGFSQLQGTIQSVTLILNGLASERPNFLGFLVQAPSGNAFEAMSFADGSASTISSPVSLVLSDDGSAGLQSSTDNQESCTSGSPCKPADDYSQITPLFNDTFPSPAPGASLIGKPYPTGSATFTSAFGGGSANGTWLLYLNNWLAENPPNGQLGSWCLNFTMQSNAHPTKTSVSGSPNPASAPASSTASVTLTANVSVADTSGLTVGAGTVSFVDGATTLGTSPVSNGQATLNTSLAEGTHQIVASYSGTDTGTEFGISTAAFDQRVDTATTKPTSATGAGPYTFCNPGSIVAPGLGNDSGPASPYPSNIFVSGLPGTVQAVRITLNGFQTKDQGDLLSLLVGPGGNNLDFFSLTGSNVSAAPSPFDLTFADGASSVSGNLSSSGTYEPTSRNTDLTFPQCPPNAPLCGILGVGPALASNPFTPTNKAATAGTSILGNADAEGVFGGTSSSTYNGNGTWSLYLDDGGPTAGGEPINVNGGWCVALTQNLPSISVTAQSPSTFTQGGTGSFQVNITNEGAGPIGDPTATTANAMTVVDTLPTGLTYAGFTGTDWSCAAGGQTVVCTNEDTVAADTSFNALSINANVSSTASGAIGNNTVSVSDAEASSNPVPSSGAVTIDVPPVITSANSTVFTSGIPGSFMVTTAAGTFPTAALSETGPLPGTVTFTDIGNGTAILAGTPDASNAFSIMFTGQNGFSPNATQNFTLNVLPGLASRFAITVPPTAFVGTAFNFTVTALDSFGNQATGYSGAIAFTSTDPGATLPATTLLVNGTGTFSATLLAPGVQTIIVTDTVNPHLTIASSGILVASPGFGSVNVCPAGQTTPAPCNKTQTLSFNIPAGTTIGSIKILTLGLPNLDFQAQASDTSTTLCKAQTYPSATTCTVDVTFAPLYAGERNGAVEILDGSGNVIAATNISGTGGAPVIAFTPATQLSLTGAPGFSFGEPSSVALDGSGNIFVSDFGNDAVYEMLAAGGYTTVNTLGGGFAFGGPAGVAIDGGGNLFVADFNKKAIYEIPPASGYTTAPTQLATGFTFSGPTDVALDGNGNLFVTDHNSAVYEVLAAGGYTTVIRLASSFTFGLPSGLAVDGSGNVFVSDFGNVAVYEILAAGGYTTVNQLGSSFVFKKPLGVAVDASGNVLVADGDFTNVFEILAPGGYTTVVPLGSGFGSPWSITAGPGGDVYVADAGGTGVLPAVQLIQRSQPPPALSFATTTIGSTSSDSPKSVQVENVGNQPLTGTGELSDTTDFTVAGSPNPATDCVGHISLSPGAQCILSFSFTPQSAGPLASTGTLTDNSLNGNPAIQTIQLTGTGKLPPPQLSGISPNYGAPAALIKIAGTNFGATKGNSTVTVGGAPSYVVSWSNAAISIQVPSNATTGNIVVTVGGAASNGVPFTFYPYPAITGISPAIGTIGTPVTITGTGLMDGGGNGAVTFNGTQAAILSQSQTSIQVDVPPGATTGPVSVRANGNTVKSSTNFTITQITGISPNYGSPAALIKITGTSFGATQGSSRVTVGGAPSYVVSWSNTAISIQVPSNATTGNIVVTVDGAASNGVAFTFHPFPAITGLSPTSGTVGTPVTITGTGLMDGGGNGAVTFNGTPAAIITQSGTSIQVNVPAGATTGPVSVHANGNTVKSSTSFTVIVPQISGLSPNYGAPSALVHITGANFGATRGNGTVTTGGASTYVVSWSDTTIAILVPSNATTGNIVVNAGGTSSNGSPFTFYPYPSITGLSATSGPVGTPVTITGTSLMDGGVNGTVTFNGTPAAILSHTSTSILVDVPPGATTGPVHVRANGVTVTSPINFTVTPASP